MPRPQYPLETVLRHRKRQEEDRQLELAAAQQRLEAEQAALAALEEKRRQTLAVLRERQLALALDVDLVTCSLNYATSLATAIAAQEQIVAGLARQADEARERLLEASRAAKVVEKLKHTWLEEQRVEELKRQEEVAAETTLNRFIGRR